MNRKEFLMGLVGGGAVIVGGGNTSGSPGIGDQGLSSGEGSGGPVGPGKMVKIVGVGGGGGNMLYEVDRMREQVAALIAVNTDNKALERITLEGAVQKVSIGARATSGRGANSNPEIGRRAALEDRDALRDALRGAGLVVIIAGMGGGTGSGAAPVVAEVSRELGAFTIGVVTMPFSFEGERRERHAREAILRLQAATDAVVVISQDHVIGMQKGPARIAQVFELLDGFVATAATDLVKSLSGSEMGRVERSDLAGKGLLHVGLGTATVVAGGLPEAMRQAAASPLFPDKYLQTAAFVLVVITAGDHMGNHVVEAALSDLRSRCPQDVSMDFCMVENASLVDTVRVTLYVTGGKSGPLPDNVVPMQRA